MEILAPAGSREALERAQAAGADAVYLGFSAFSARAGAGNFNEEQLEDAIRFAHLHHMRVYVTVNTLVRDDEMPEVHTLMGTLNRLRADGVLIQDAGIVRMTRRCFPGLRIHASTQMAIHNASGVRWCARMEMKRVVMARECSLAEIRRCVEAGAPAPVSERDAFSGEDGSKGGIGGSGVSGPQSTKAGVEIEVFGHGAQCVSVSGECLFSSMAGERSGNRGRCAQPCRKRYRLDGKEGAWLSPRDLCLRDELPALREAGVASLKIEGRLKRPEYVYTVTESYRAALDSLEAGTFRAADGAEQEALRQIFHRGGFMRGYAFGAEDAEVIFPAAVNHQGVPLGRVTESRNGFARVRLDRALGDGDGLRFRHGDREEEEMTYSGKPAGPGETVRLRLREGMRAWPGDEVTRLTDASALALAMAAPLRRIPVDMELEAWPGREASLRLSDGETEVTVRGETVSAARTRETVGEEMERQLRKTGGTDWEAREVRVRTAGAFMPVSALNGLRREGLAALAEARCDRFAYPMSQEIPEEEKNPAYAPSHDSGREPAWIVTVRTPEQAQACRKEDTLLVWYPEDFRSAALDALAEEMRPGEWLRLPEVCEEETLRRIHVFAEEHRELLGGVLLGSVGQLGLSWPVPVAAGPGIPVMNREAAELLREQGCRFAMASPELTGEQTEKLINAGAELLRDTGRAPAGAEGSAGLPLAVQVYGRTQLMLLHHCPARTALGWSRGHGECRLCEEEDPRALRGKALEDEKGYRFPMLRTRLPEGCLVRLLNTLPTDLGDRWEQSPRAAEMTVETGDEARLIMERLRKGEKTPGESTRGHWNRPVL